MSCIVIQTSNTIYTSSDCDTMSIAQCQHGSHTGVDSDHMHPDKVKSKNHQYLYASNRARIPFPSAFVILICWFILVLVLLCTSSSSSVLVSAATVSPNLIWNANQAFSVTSVSGSAFDTTSLPSAFSMSYGPNTKGGVSACTPFSVTTVDATVGVATCTILANDVAIGQPVTFQRASGAGSTNVPTPTPYKPTGTPVLLAASAAGIWPFSTAVVATPNSGWRAGPSGSGGVAVFTDSVTPHSLELTAFPALVAKETNGGFTITMWLRITTWADTASILLLSNGVNTNDAIDIKLSGVDSMAITFYDFVGTAVWTLTTPAGMRRGPWTFVAFSINQAGLATAYLDGVTPTTIAGRTYAGGARASARLWGKRFTTATPLYAPGEIAYLHYFHRALTVTEVGYMFNFAAGGNGVTASSLIPVTVALSSVSWADRTEAQIRAILSIPRGIAHTFKFTPSATFNDQANVALSLSFTALGGSVSPSSLTWTSSATGQDFIFTAPATGGTSPTTISITKTGDARCPQPAAFHAAYALTTITPTTGTFWTTPTIAFTNINTVHSTGTFAIQYGPNVAGGFTACTLTGTSHTPSTSMGPASCILSADIAMGQAVTFQTLNTGGVWTNIGATFTYTPTGTPALLSDSASSHWDMTGTYTSANQAVGPSGTGNIVKFTLTTHNMNLNTQAPVALTSTLPALVAAGFSFSFWIRLTAPVDTASILLLSDGTTLNNAIDITLNGLNKAQITFYDAGGITPCTRALLGTNLRVGAWAHIVFTINKNAAGTVIGYLDKVASAASTCSFSTGSRASALMFGKRPSVTLFNTGELASIHYFPRALNALEVTYLYDRIGTAGATSALLPGTFLVASTTTPAMTSFALIDNILSLEMLNSAVTHTFTVTPTVVFNDLTALPSLHLSPSLSQAMTPATNPTWSWTTYEPLAKSITYQAPYPPWPIAGLVTFTPTILPADSRLSMFNLRFILTFAATITWSIAPTVIYPTQTATITITLSKYNFQDLTMTPTIQDQLTAAVAGTYAPTSYSFLTANIPAVSITPSLLTTNIVFTPNLATYSTYLTTDPIRDMISSLSKGTTDPQTRYTLSPVSPSPLVLLLIKPLETFVFTPALSTLHGGLFAVNSVQSFSVTPGGVNTQVGGVSLVITVVTATNGGALTGGTGTTTSRTLTWAQGNVAAQTFTYTAAAQAPPASPGPAQHVTITITVTATNRIHRFITNQVFSVNDVTALNFQYGEPSLLFGNAALSPITTLPTAFAFLMLTKNYPDATNYYSIKQSAIAVTSTFGTAGTTTAQLFSVTGAPGSEVDTAVGAAVTLVTNSLVYLPAGVDQTMATLGNYKIKIVSSLSGTYVVRLTRVAPSVSSISFEHTTASPFGTALTPGFSAPAAPTFFAATQSTTGVLQWSAVSGFKSGRHMYKITVPHAHQYLKVSVAFSSGPITPVMRTNFGDKGTILRQTRAGGYAKAGAATAEIASPFNTGTFYGGGYTNYVTFTAETPVNSGMWLNLTSSVFTPSSPLPYLLYCGLSFFEVNSPDGYYSFEVTRQPAVVTNVVLFDTTGGTNTVILLDPTCPTLAICADLYFTPTQWYKVEQISFTVTFASGDAYLLNSDSSAYPVGISTKLTSTVPINVLLAVGSNSFRIHHSIDGYRTFSMVRDPPRISSVSPSTVTMSGAPTVISLYSSPYNGFAGTSDTLADITSVRYGIMGSDSACDSYTRPSASLVTCTITDAPIGVALRFVVSVNGVASATSTATVIFDVPMTVNNAHSGSTLVPIAFTKGVINTVVFTLQSAPVDPATVTLTTLCTKISAPTIGTATATVIASAATVTVTSGTIMTVPITVNDFDGNGRCAYSLNHAAYAVPPPTFFTTVPKIQLTQTGNPGTARLAFDASTFTVSVAAPTAGALAGAGVASATAADNQVTLTLTCASTGVTARTFTYTPTTININSGTTTATTVTVTFAALASATVSGYDVTCSWGTSAVTGAGNRLLAPAAFSYFVGQPFSLTAVKAAYTPAAETNLYVTQTNLVTVASSAGNNAPTGGFVYTVSCDVGTATAVAGIAAGASTSTWTYTAPSVAVAATTATCTYTAPAGVLAQYYTVPSPTTFTIAAQILVAPKGIPTSSNVVPARYTAGVIASIANKDIIIPRPVPALPAGTTLIVGIASCTANNVAITVGTAVTFTDASTTDGIITISGIPTPAATGIFVKCTMSPLGGTVNAGAVEKYYNTLNTFSFVVAQYHTVEIAKDADHYNFGTITTDKSTLTISTGATTFDAGTFSITVTATCNACSSINNAAYVALPVLSVSSVILTNAARSQTLTIKGSQPGSVTCTFAVSDAGTADAMLISSTIAPVTIVTYPVQQITASGFGITLAGFSNAPTETGVATGLAASAKVVTLAIPSGTQPTNVAGEYLLSLACNGNTGTVTVAPSVATDLFDSALPTFTLTWTDPAAADASLLITCTWTASGTKTARYIKPVDFSFIVAKPKSFTVTVENPTVAQGATTVPIITVLPPVLATASTVTTSGITITMTCLQTVAVNNIVTSTFNWAAGSTLDATTAGPAKTFNFPVLAANAVSPYTCTFAMNRLNSDATDARRFLKPTNSITVTVTPTAVVPLIQLTSTAPAIITAAGGASVDNQFLVETVVGQYVATTTTFTLTLECSLTDATGTPIAAITKTFSQTALNGGGAYQPVFSALDTQAIGRSYTCVFTLGGADAAMYIVPSTKYVNQGVATAFTAVVAAATIYPTGTGRITLTPVNIYIPQSVVFSASCLLPASTPVPTFNWISGTSVAITTVTVGSTTTSTIVGTYSGSNAVVNDTLTISTSSNTALGAYACTFTITSIGQNIWFTAPVGISTVTVIPFTFIITDLGTATQFSVTPIVAPLNGGTWARIICTNSVPYTATFSRFFYFFEGLTTAQTFTANLPATQFGAGSCMVNGANGQSGATPGPWNEARFIDSSSLAYTYGARPVMTHTTTLVNGRVVVPACGSATVTFTTTATLATTLTLTCAGSYVTVTPVANTAAFVAGTTASFSLDGRGSPASIVCTADGAGLYASTTSITAYVGTPVIFAATNIPTVAVLTTPKTISVSLPVLPYPLIEVTLTLACIGASVDAPATHSYSSSALAAQTFTFTATAVGSVVCTWSATTTPGGNEDRFVLPTGFTISDVAAQRTITLAGATHIQYATTGTFTVIPNPSTALLAAYIVNVTCTDGIVPSPTTTVFDAGTIAPIAATFTITAPAATSTTTSTVCTVSSTSEIAKIASSDATRTITFSLTPINPSLSSSSSGSGSIASNISSSSGSFDEGNIHLSSSSLTSLTLIIIIVLSCLAALVLILYVLWRYHRSHPKSEPRSDKLACAIKGQTTNFPIFQEIQPASPSVGTVVLESDKKKLHIERETESTHSVESAAVNDSHKIVVKVHTEQQSGSINDSTIEMVTYSPEVMHAAVDVEPSLSIAVESINIAEQDHVDVTPISVSNIKPSTINRRCRPLKITTAASTQAESAVSPAAAAVDGVTDSSNKVQVADNSSASRSATAEKQLSEHNPASFSVPAHFASSLSAGENANMVAFAAHRLSDVASKIFPPCAIIFDLIAGISTLCGVASSNQVNCRFLSQRCSALLPVLQSVQQHWRAVEMTDSKAAAERVDAILPSFEHAITEFTSAAKLIKEMSQKGKLRQLVQGNSVKEQFVLQDSRLSSVVSSLQLGLAGEAVSQNEQIIQSLATSLPYMDEKLDQLLAAGAVQADQLQGMGIKQDEAVGALASMRMHVKQMKSAGVGMSDEQRAFQDMQAKKMEELADLVKAGMLAMAVAAKVMEPMSPLSSARVSNPSTQQLSPAHAVSFNKSFEIAPWEIKLLEEIGRGSFGAVYRAMWREQEVAVKKLLLSASNDEVAADFQQEVAMLCSIRFNRLLQVYGANLSRDDPFIVCEFMERGSLHECLQGSDLANRPPTSHLLQMSIQIMEGIAFMHNSNPRIIHRDIKSANVLVDASWNCKISDFGLAKTLHTDASMSTRAAVGVGGGTLAYLPHEALSDEPLEADTAADMYSAGVLLWELWTGQVPHKGRTVHQIISMVGVKGQSLPIPTDDSLPKYIKQILKALFLTRKERPSATAVLQHLRKQIVGRRTSVTVHPSSASPPPAQVSHHPAFNSTSNTKHGDNTVSSNSSSSSSSSSSSASSAAVTGSSKAASGTLSSNNSSCRTRGATSPISVSADTNTFDSNYSHTLSALASSSMSSQK